MRINNILFKAWERYRLLVFLVASVAVVVVVVSPLTGCAAAPARKGSTPTKQRTVPAQLTDNSNTNALFPVLLIAGAVALMVKRQHGHTTSP